MTQITFEDHNIYFAQYVLNKMPLEAVLFVASALLLLYGAFRLAAAKSDQSKGKSQAIMFAAMMMNFSNILKVFIIAGATNETKSLSGYFAISLEIIGIVGFIAACGMYIYYSKHAEPLSSTFETNRT